MIYLLPPPQLYRITTRERLLIQDGYLQPHFKESNFGLFLPTAVGELLLLVAHYLIHNPASELFQSPEFLLLILETKELQYVSASRPFFEGEFFAQVPVTAIARILSFKWSDNWELEYNDSDGDPDKCWQLLGAVDLKILRNRDE